MSATTTTIQQQQQQVSKAGNGEGPGVPDKSEVGWLFVQQYYTFLNDQPQKLHLFYTKQSTMCHGVEGEAVPSYYGQSQIIQRIKEHQFNNCKVLISNMDCQESANGGVVVQVLGEMANNGLPSQKFVQTFFLAQQPRGYYVLNDIFRFLKEDVNEDAEPTDVISEKAAEPAAATASASASASSATAAAAATSTAAAPAAVATQTATAPVAQVKESSTAVAAEAPTNPQGAAAAKQLAEKPSESVKETPKESSGAPEAAAAAAAAPKDTVTKEAAVATKEATTSKAATKVDKAAAGATSAQANGSAPASSAPLSWASMAAKKKDAELNGHAAAAAAASASAPQAPAASATQTATAAASATSGAATATTSATAATAAATASTQTGPAQTKPTPHTNNIIVTTRPGQNPGRRPQEYHSAYIRNVSVKVDDALLRKGLENIGQLTHFQVEKAKNCAFVDFIDAATLKAALAVHELKVGGQTVLIEERKRGGAKSKNSNQKKGGFTNVKAKKA